MRSPWRTVFRLGLYDLLMPPNFDESIRATFALLDPGPREHVLEVGVGSGRSLVHAAKWLKAGGRLTAIDIEEEGLRRVRTRARQLGVERQVSLLHADMLKLDGVVPSRFDGAFAHFAIYTLESKEERRTAIEQVAALLRPGAPFVITVPSEDYTAKALMEEARRIERERPEASALTKWFRCRFVYGIGERGTRRAVEERMLSGRYHRYTEADVREEFAHANLHLASIERCRSVRSYRARGIKGP
jgi:ubiquinone/menaquinone biosynthesis C-methylase UbiE